jgi:hypothetical protein
MKINADKTALQEPTHLMTDIVILCPKADMK